MHTFQRQSGLVLALLLSLSATIAHAHGRPQHPPGWVTTNLLGSNFSLSPGETRSLSLDGYRNVQKIFVQVESQRYPATFEVIANGDVKGTVYVPATDPSYVVTIGETAHSLEFRHTSGAGTLHIFNVKALVSNAAYSPRRSGGWLSPDRSEDVATLAYTAIEAINQIEPQVVSADFDKYLLPIKKAAGRTYASARGRGDMSRKTVANLEALQASIGLAGPYLETLMSADSVFDLTTELLAVAERIDDLLQ